MVKFYFGNSLNKNEVNSVIMALEKMGFTLFGVGQKKI